jgi:putative transposase
MAGGRRSIRLRHFDYSQPAAYFITACTHQRACMFGEISGTDMHCNALGQIVADTWHALPQRFVGVVLDEFVVMPNHVHGILQMTHEAAAQLSLAAIMRAFKSVSAIAATRLQSRRGTPLWQRNYYERVVRSDYELQRIREYIVNNPAHWHEDPERNPDV